MTKRKEPRRRSSAAQAAAIKKFVLRFAKNPLISFSDIAEVLKVSPQRVQQIATAAPGLIEKRKADHKKYFANLGKGLPKIKL